MAVLSRAKAFTISNLMLPICKMDTLMILDVCWPLPFLPATIFRSFREEHLNYILRELFFGYQPRRFKPKPLTLTTVGACPRCGHQKVQLPAT